LNDRHCDLIIIFASARLFYVLSDSKSGCQFFQKSSKVLVLLESYSDSDSINLLFIATPWSPERDGFPRFFGEAGYWLSGIDGGEI
jgi:hypothetical protein